MARIRTLKPEFWCDEKLAPLPVIDRLVFLGLISLADDAGRMVDNVKALDGDLFPLTDDTCRDSLERLAAAGRIVRYRSASGQRLIQLVHWARHQKVTHASAYVLPAPTVTDSPETLLRLSGESQESLRKVSCSDLGPRTMDHGPRTNDLTTSGGALTRPAEDSGGAVAVDLAPAPAVVVTVAEPAPSPEPAVPVPAPMPVAPAGRRKRAPRPPADDKSTRFPNYPMDDCQYHYRSWTVLIGGLQGGVGRFRSALGEFYQPTPQFTRKQVYDAILCYSEVRDAEPASGARWFTFPAWIGDLQRWIRLGEQPHVDPVTGEPTERGRLGLYRALAAGHAGRVA